MKKRLILLMLTALVGAQAVLYAQTTADEPYVFPQWAKDIRRFEIVTFGVFPFAWLFTSIGIDLYRSSLHGWAEDGYYPWPVTGKNPVAWNNDNYVSAFTYAGLAAVSVAVIDFIIIQMKRSIAARKARAYEPSAPEIRRVPLNAPPASAETPPPENTAETPPPVENSAKGAP